jgi:adenine phosphoribosyltransferase
MADTALPDPRLSAIEAAIGLIPDFPQPGILFRDITPLMAAPAALADAVDLLAEAIEPMRASALVAVEARGFLFGAPLALALRLPLVPVRKPGKLPGETHGVDYGLEYGRDRLELHVGALMPGARAVIIDDLLATGGTVGAAAELIRRSGAEVAGAAFLIELEELGGRARLAAQGVTCAALLSY